MAPSGPQDGFRSVFAVKVWVASGDHQKPLLILLEISSGVWGQTAPTGHVITGAYDEHNIGIPHSPSKSLISLS